MKIKLFIVCAQQNDGSYVAICPDMDNLLAQGDTCEQTILQLKDLIKVIIDEGLTTEELQKFTQIKPKIFSEYEFVI